MIISLTGFMGCGKSTVGALLARRLGVPFLDLDTLICDREGRSIPSIFATDGEEGFRRIEQECLEEVVAQYADAPEKLVLALGGGTVTTPACAELVRERTFCIWLQALEEELRRILAGDESRPMLKTHDFETLFHKRTPLYSAVAAQIVPINGFNYEELARKIEQIIILW